MTQSETIFEPPTQPQSASCVGCRQPILIYPNRVENDCGVNIGAPREQHVCFQHKLILPYQDGLVQTTYGPRLKEILELGYDIGLCDYEIYDEEFRPVLNQRIVDHFFMREIGAETPELFIFYLNRAMNENMPVFSTVFKILHDATFDPISNVDMKTTQDQNAQGNSRSEGVNDTTENGTAHADATTTSDTQNVNSNAPQVNIATAKTDGYWNTGVFAEGKGTSLTDSETSSASHATTGMDNKYASLSGYVLKMLGRQGITGYQALREYLDAYVNPLTELFEVLEPCFSQLWTDHMNGF